MTNLIGYRAEELQHKLADVDGSKNLFYQNPEDEHDYDIATIRAFTTVQWFFFNLMAIRAQRGPERPTLNIAVDLTTLFPGLLSVTKPKAKDALRSKQIIKSISQHWVYQMGMCMQFNLRTFIIDTPEPRAAPLLMVLDDEKGLPSRIQGGIVNIIPHHRLYNVHPPKKDVNGPWAVYNPKDTGPVTEAGGLALVKVN